jgi:two-component system NtrC family sensor kinase
MNHEFDWQLKLEKIEQLYRLAEFGRLSSGVFHDLINPLTAVSLNLEQIKKDDQDNLINAKDCLHQAIAASHKMEDLIDCIKRSIRQEDLKTTFSPRTEIDSIIKILDYKVRKANIKIDFKKSEEINLYGNPVKFSQIIINLISNSIDAYEASGGTTLKTINIHLTSNNNQMTLEVNDQGEGINNENLSKIFQPFFSTKNGRGLGLGLSSSKNIVEKEFFGSINVKSIPNQKTSFTVIMPLGYAN